MSIFSDTLKTYIEIKEIKVHALADYCGMERSTLYKFINGKREPASTETLDKIIRFMRLTPAESQELTTAWKITRAGEEVYYTRKSMENFLCHFPSRPAGKDFEDTPIPAFDEALSAEKDCLSLGSIQQLNSCVHQIILKECRKKEGHIELLLQPDYAFLFNLLAILKPADNIKIRHIICLDKKPELTKNHELNSFYYLREIFPVYMNRMDYETFYFYDSIDSHFNNLNLLPCLILTSEAAVLCSPDYQNGIYCREPEVVKMLHASFSSALDKCAPLFDVIQAEPSGFFSKMQTNYAPEKGVLPMIALEPEACMQPFITCDLMNECINRALPQSDEIVFMALQAFELNKKRLREKNLTVYFTEEGIEHFAETGRIDEIPDIFYHPLSVERRIEILRQLAICCLDGTYRMLQKPLNHLPTNLHLFAAGKEDCGFSYTANDGSTLLLFIREPGLSGILPDYLENMDEDLLYPETEAAAAVKNIIRHLENRQPSQ